MKEYVEEHGPTTLAEFTKIWLAVDESTKQVSARLARTIHTV